VSGLFSPGSPLKRPAEELALMLGAIAHRGPDAQGVHVEARLAMGTRRLAIVDLIGGRQPLYSEDGSICAVYNGEIYNHEELRAPLVRGGHRLASDTDGEILPHLYEERGIDFVGELNGMFAFALWDARAGRLHLARDRFGVKPLYYAWDGRTLAFSSEVRALLEAGRVRASLDVDACLELLTFQNILSDRSLFRGVSLLPAGTILTLDADGLSLRSYWDPLPRHERTGDLDELSGRIGECFSRAVERQLMSDVELASYLSGGLDTGAVTAEARRRLPRLTTFSTGFDVSGAVGMEAGFDELADAAALAGHLDTHHHELVLDSQDMEMVLPRIVRHLEEPRMSFSYPNYLTAGVASRWVKVVLSGVGGDELFGGYPWRYALADGRPDFDERYFSYWERLLPASELASALRPGLVSESDLARPRAVFDAVRAPAGDLPELDRILYTESKTFLHGLLVIEDKLSMAHSLESRVPFLDNDLVDLMLTIPAESKLYGRRSKELFRRAMVGVLPEEVVSRPKTGFTPPQATWFKRDQMGYVRATLLSEQACDHGLLEPDYVRRIIDEHEQGTADRRLLLWTLLGLEWWQRIFLDGEHVT